MEGDTGSESAGPDEWGSAVASGDAAGLAQLVLVWSGSKPVPALSILEACVSLFEKEIALSNPDSSPLQSLPTTPGEWGSTVTSGDATKLAKLALVWSDSKPERALSVLTNCVSLMEKEVAFSAPSSPLQSPPSTPGPSLVNAFVVALDETCDGKSWYTSTKELQLASLELCLACRNYHTVHLIVDSQIPRRLLAAADAPPPHPTRLCGTRVPRLRARRATWNMPTAAELRNPIFAMRGVDWLEFGDDFEGSLDAVALPERLKMIKFHFSSLFDRPIDLVRWPASLQKLAFGKMFNQPIEKVVWPTSLEQLTFRHRFNQPIQRASFPASLYQLTFGYKFNQPIEGVLWPDSLQRLVFGTTFNQPVDNVKWPATLQELTFGYNRVGKDNRMVMYSQFNQRIDSSVWPSSMRRLTLGGIMFRQSLQGLGTWMPNLETLYLLNYSGHGDILLRQNRMAPRPSSPACVSRNDVMWGRGSFNRTGLPSLPIALMRPRGAAVSVDDFVFECIDGRGSS